MNRLFCFFLVILFMLIHDGFAEKLTEKKVGFCWKTH